MLPTKTLPRQDLQDLQDENRSVFFAFILFILSILSILLDLFVLTGSRLLSPDLWNVVALGLGGPQRGQTPVHGRGTDTFRRVVLLQSCFFREFRRTWH